MADDIASVGIKVDTDGVTGGIKALDALADQGPKVEKSLQGVETASAKTGKSLATLGQGASGEGLAKVGKTAKEATDSVTKLGDSTTKTVAAVKQVDKASADTARAIVGVGTAVKSLVTSNEAVVASIRGLSTAEAAYIAKLQEEQTQLRAAIAERDRYVAQAQGMLAASKDIAAAIGGQVDGLKRVQGASAQAGESMLGLARTGVSAFLGSAVVQGAKAAAAAIYEASAAGERLRTTLNFATGGNGAQEIEYLRQVTGRLGLEFNSTAIAYGKFQAASRGTAIEGAKARDVFESIAKASAVMGLSTEESSGALLALQQMISKGTVQAEELRGQLGERLPGAFQIAAKAMGVTTAELGKLLEQGQVVADDFLPKFARALNESLGAAADNAANRLDAATNRFANSWERLKQTVGDAGVSKAIQGQINGVSEELTVLSETMERVKKEGGSFLAQIGAGGGNAAARLAFHGLNDSANLLNSTINALTGNLFKLNTNVDLLPAGLKTNAQQAELLARDLAKAEEQFVALKAQGGTEGGNIYWKSELYQLAQYIKKLKEAQAEQIKLQQGNTDSQAGDTFRTNRAAEEARQLEATRAAMQKVTQGLADVKDSFYKDLNALYAGFKAGLISLADYQAAVAKLINDSGGGKERAAGLKAVNKELTDQKKLTLELNGLNGDFLDDWTHLNKAYKEGRLNLEQLEKAQDSLLKKQPAIKEAEKEKIELAKALYAQSVQTSEEIAAAFVAESKAREQGRLAVYNYAKAIDEQNALTEFELGLVGKTQRARDVALAQYRIELDLKKQIEAIDRNSGFDEAQRIEERTKAREAAARAIAGAETRAYVDEWKRTSDEIERSLTDALLRGFESGKGFAKNFRDTLVNMFQTLVLRPTIKAIVQPAASTITNLAGAPGVANAAGSLLPGLFGSSPFTAAGAGQAGGVGSGLFSSLSTAAAALATISSISQGKFGAAAGTAIGTYFGPIGSLVGNVIGSAIDKAFGSAGTPQQGGSYLSNGTTGQAVNGGMFGLDRAWGDSIGKYFSQGVQDALKTVTGTGAGLLNALSTAFGGAGGYQVGAFYASDNNRPSQGNTSVIGPNGQILSSTSRNNYDKDAQKGLEQLTTVLAGDVRAALQQIDIPGWAKDELQALASSAGFSELATAVQQIVATKQALVDLGALMPQLGGLTDAAVSGLLKAFDGIQNLQTAASSYYDNFYSDAEKTASATAALTRELAAFGIAVPASRDAYRQLVEAQDLSTESGRAAYAQLLKLAPAFAALVPAAQEAAESVDQAAQQMIEAGQKVLADLARQQGDLQVELLKAQGDAAGAAALARQQTIDRLTAGLSDTDKAAAIAALDYNNALQQQIDALGAAATAAQQAAAAQQQAAAAEQQRLQAVANERYGLETQLLQLQGNTAALRERELAALDPTNRAILQNIFALQDQQAAQQAAAQAAQQAAQAQEEAARAAEQLRNSWQSVTDTLLDEVRRIRGVMGADSPQSLASAQAQFAIATAKARAGDQDAAKLLPSLSEAILSLAQAQLSSGIDLKILRAQIAASLNATAGQIAGQYGFQLPKLDTGTNYVPKTMAVVVHPGEAVVPRAYNPAVGGNAADMDKVVAAIESLRADQRTQASTLVRIGNDTFKVVKSWDLRGLPKERSEENVA